MNTGKTAMEMLLEYLDSNAAYLSNPHDDERDRYAGQAYKDAANKVRELFPTEQAAEQDRWISVSSGVLPERATEESRLSVDVIIWDDGPVIGYYNFLRKHWRRGLLVVYPTHWQNFPPAPTAPDKEKE